MRIFADHCVNTDVVIALRETGFKIERASEKNLAKATDEEIYNYVLKSKQILLTFDKDFGNIVRFNIRHSKGIVIIYVERMNKKQIVDKTVTFFKKIKVSLLKGTLFIVEHDDIRIWPRF